MNINNHYTNTLTSPSSINNKKIYNPYLEESLHRNPLNPLIPHKIYPKSNILIFKKHSLFDRNRYKNNNNRNNTNNKTLNLSLSRNIDNKSHADFHNIKNERIIMDYNHKNNNNSRAINKKGNINMNSSLKKDLDMMKLQMSCDLITHKINQIKNRVQNLHEASIKDDKNLINKNKDIKIYKKNSSNYFNFNSSFSRSINSNLNTEINSNLERRAFMDFSKLENDKFKQISNEMSQEIYNTFDDKYFDKYDDTFRKINNIKIPYIKKNEIGNRNIKLSYKNNLKYLLNDTQNNGKKNLYNNRL